MVAVGLAQSCGCAAMTVLMFPFGYAKVLMQVGHEPLAPERSTRFWIRHEVYEYPNIFRYNHIRSVDGFTGLYRGLVPKVMAGVVDSLVQSNIEERIKEGARTYSNKTKEEEFIPWLKTFTVETSKDTLSRCCGVIASHPFHVIMVRCMVQFIGRETKYNTVFSSVREIYSHDGVLGFFVGLTPRLIGEIITIWMTGFLIKVVDKYLIQEKDLKSYTGATCGLIVSHYTYPFTLVTNIMIVCDSGLACGQYPTMLHYKNWFDCMKSLAKEGDLKRGANAFWRVYRSHPSVVPFVGVQRGSKLSRNIVC